MRGKSHATSLGAAVLTVAVLTASLLPASTGATIEAKATTWEQDLLRTHALVQDAMARAGVPVASLPQPLPVWAASLPPWAGDLMAQPKQAPVRALALADALLGGSGLDAMDTAWGLQPVAAPAGGLTGIVAAVRTAQAVVHAPAAAPAELRAAQAGFAELQALLDTKPWEPGLDRLATDPPADAEAMQAWLHDTMGWVDEVQAHVDRLAPVAARLDPATSQAALRLVLAAIDAAAPQLEATSATGVAPQGIGAGDPCDGPATPPLFADPQNGVAVFGQEPNCHRDPCNAGDPTCHPADNARIRIDLGGDDQYFGRTGTATGTGTDFVRVSIDVAGNDRYVGGDLAQGAGFTGVGVLADLGSGNDAYTCTTRCQGYGGLAGAGALVDQGGADTYTAVASAQGVGAEMGGSGALLDAGGNDRYMAATVAQGTGMFGQGLLYDGGGDDVYQAPYIAQAAGLAVATGVLVDVSGADSYSSVPGSTFGAGQAAGVVGAGVLVDGGGDDRYAVGLTDVGLAQASSAIGAAVLVDTTGNDLYATATRDVTGVLQSTALGLGAVSVMLDGAGNDRYGGTGPGAGSPVASALLQGQTTAIGGAALLYDAGGNDVYVGGDRCPVVVACFQYGQGSVLIAGVAVLADGAGDDKYYGGDWTQGAGSGLDLVETIAASVGVTTGRNVENFALLLDAGGADVYLGGKQRAVPLDCQPTTRAYHGIAFLSGAARLLDLGAGADSYAARVGSTPAANNIEWNHGCRTITVLGVSTTIQAGGGKDS